MGKKKKGSKKGKKGKGKGKGSEDVAKQAAVRAAIVERKLAKNVAGLKDRLRRTVSSAVETKYEARAVADDAEDRAELADSEILYMLNQYKRRTATLEHERDDAVSDLSHLQTTIADAEERAQHTIDRQAKEIKTLATIVSQNETEIARLKSEFQFDTRDAQIDDLELQLRQLENARKTEAAALERRYVLNQAGLRDEMEGLVMKVGKTFQEQSQERLGETARKALEENAIMGREILELSDGTDAIIKEKEKLVLKLDQLRIDLQIAEDAQTTLMKTNDRNGKIIDRLRDKVLEARTQAQNAELKVTGLEDELQHQHKRGRGGGGGGGSGDGSSSEDGDADENDGAANDEEGEGGNSKEAEARLAQTQRLEDMLSKHDAETSAMARIALLGQALDAATDQASRQHKIRLRHAREQFGKDLVDAKTVHTDLLAQEHAFFLETLAGLQIAMRGGENPAKELLVMVHERLRKTVNSWQIPNVTSRGVQTVAGGGDPSKKPKKAVKPHWNRANSVMNRGGTRADRTTTAAVTAGANARPQTAPSKVGFGGSYRPAPASRRPAGSAVVSASSTTTSTSAASPSLARSRRASTETSALLKRPTSAATMMASSPTTMAPGGRSRPPSRNSAASRPAVTTTTQPMDIYFNPQPGASSRAAGKVPSKKKGGSSGDGSVRSDAWASPASSPQLGPRKRTGVQTPNSRML